MSTSLVEKQLFSNNASSTLVSSVSAIDTVLSLAPGSGSAFPYPSTNQYFLATIDSEDFLEVVKCTSRLGDTLTVVRAQEGTTSYPFPSGTLVQVRVTKGTLEEFSKSTERLYDVLSVDSLPRAGDAAGNSFVCNSQDDYGNPIVAIKRDDLWSFASHTTSLVDGLASIGGSTSLSSTAVPLLPTAPYQGRYIVQFTSGTLRGICRLVIMTSGNVLTWAEPTPTAVTAGTTFTVYLSNAYQFSLVSTVPSKAPLASPALTGTPTAPTPAEGDNTTKIATMQALYAATRAYGLGSNGTSIADCNLVTASGFYRINTSLANGYPAHTSGDTLLSMVYSATYGTQFGVANAGNKIWTRSQYNGVWSSWVEVARFSDTYTRAEIDARISDESLVNAIIFG